ncbi:MAG TPA: type VI secretion system contractile sheath large subunit [Polyangiaceae bacterium]|jgi:type VI secretion system protein ImpC
MTEDRSGGIASFGVGFGSRKQGEDGGPPVVEERSFRVVVIAEVVASADWSTGRSPPLEPIRIDAETFDAVMGQLAPSLGLEVADPFGAGDPPLRVDLVWRDRKSMRPAELVEQVPALRALVDARRVVQDVAARKLTAEAARAQLARILPRPSWADALVNEVRPAPISAEPLVAPVAAARPAPPAPGNGGTKSGLDALLEMVDVGSEPEMPLPSEAPEPARGGVSRMIEAVARSARPGRAPRAVVGTAPQRLEQAFRNLLDGILHHPEVRRLEATWRGLRLLVEHCDRKAGVEVDVVPAGREAVAGALRRLGESDGDRPAIDLVLIDQHLETSAVDLAHLDKWAGLAGTLLAPIVLAGHPGMLGVDTLAQVARSTSALSSSDDGRAVAFRAVASREAARWATVVLNDALVRAPYTQGTSRLQQPPYEEDASDPDAYVYTNGAYIVGALCARSHARLRWPTSITGARDGIVGNLPVRTVHDRGEEAAIPLEVVPTEDAVREVARAGLTMLTCAPNSDAAILTRAPVLHRTASPSGPGASTGTLADQIFVGIFARAVQQVAGAIPVGTEPRAAEDVARISLAEMFERAAPPGPEIAARVDTKRGSLEVTVRPRRFAGITLEELTLGAALG